MDVHSTAPAATGTAAAAIEPMLILSTAHLTEETCNLFLADYAGPAWRKGDYGWFVYVPEDADSELPPDLTACLALAREKAAFWVMFDRDEAQIEELPAYEW
ncbi:MULTISPECIES: hypothetical protein [unclassified Sphingomonas]|uniref:DUF5983 family protein n=1 Tax=unclassified Sphingomonas TaxID=196159 RepID=UPI002269AF7A|nr:MULTISPECIES: hypothetical protein [unclassified Sphingomonas]